MDLTTTSKLPKRNALIEFLKISTNSIVSSYNRILPTLLSLLAKATCGLVSFVIFTIHTCSTNAALLPELRARPVFHHPTFNEMPEVQLRLYKNL